MRLKPTQKLKTITTYSMSNIEKSNKPKSGSSEAGYSHLKLLKPSNQAKSRAAAARARAKAQEQEAVTQTTSSTNGSGSGKQSKSQKKNNYKTRKERKNTANKLSPTTTETERKEKKNSAQKLLVVNQSKKACEKLLPSNKVYLCPSCDEQFETQDKCESHIQMCSFGLVKHLKPVIKTEFHEFKQTKESKSTPRSSDASQSNDPDTPNSKTKKKRVRRNRTRNKNKGPQQGVEA